MAYRVVLEADTLTALDELIQHFGQRQAAHEQEQLAALEKRQSDRRKTHHGSPAFIASARARRALTDEQVTEIRTLYETGQGTYAGLGMAYGVSLSTIQQIVQRRTYKDVA